MGMHEWFKPEIAQLPAYVAGKRDADPRVIKLSSNEVHFPPLPAVTQVLERYAGQINRYPDMANTQLRERLAEVEEWPFEGIVAGTGSTALIEKFLQAVAVPGGEVIYPWRSFEAYPIAVLGAGARPVPVPLRADGGHDLAAMAGAITDKTRAILLCSPNNPTGVGIGHQELEAFLDRVPESIPVLIDEAYIHFANGIGTAIQDGKALARNRPNVLVARTFSKAYGLAGLRVGYVLTSPEMAAGLNAIATPFGVNLLAQEAALAALAELPEVERRVQLVVEERSRMLDGIRARGFAVPESVANFVWFTGTGSDSHADTAAGTDADADTGAAGGGSENGNGAAGGSGAAEFATVDAELLERVAREEGIITRRFGTEGVRVSVAEPEGTERLWRALDRIRAGASAA
ncbi:aminotransferase [Actinobaculum suis]|uniref:histidinol-phosphate transaminase n=1 Tax=Actinobaculum suis TaxID=1657 RepID=UPI00066FC98E|nr:histidinol-phosphate transaminase [Actinobaculum suis]KMY23114.1 aminotransferase [Actinobaculum suis]